MACERFVCTLPPDRSEWSHLLVSKANHVHDFNDVIAEFYPEQAAPIYLPVLGNASSEEGVNYVSWRPFEVSTPVTTTTTMQQYRIQCHDLAWEHVWVQFGLSLSVWFVLAAIGLFLTTHTKWSQYTQSRRTELRKFELGLAGLGAGPAIAVLLVHVSQCLFWAMRASSGVVDPLCYALELLGSFVVTLDVVAKYAYQISSGTPFVIRTAFHGPLLLDAVVSTSAVGLIFEGHGAGHTWWSFSFLASLRMFGVLRNLQTGGTSLARWRRHLVGHCVTTMLIIFAAAAGMMTAEILDAPNRTGMYEEPEWKFFQVLVFVIVSGTTVGNSPLSPKTVFGRTFIVLYIFWCVQFLALRVVPIIRDHLLDRNIAVGRFTPSPGKRHVVVMGSPTGSMLWEFLLEVYHPNHFHASADFTTGAPYVVILLPEDQTLLYLRKFLQRPESLFFRDRVLLLSGDAFNPDDLDRAGASFAYRLVVLPDMGVADVASDDNANLMRTFAIGAAVPDVPMTCLLHCAACAKAGVETGRTRYLTIDRFKFSMLAMGCISRGAMTLVSNLCKTFGDMESGGQQWQACYQHGIQQELYEVSLTESYDGSTFVEVAWDTLMRSQDHDVYLIGLIEFDEDGERQVLIHPGATYAVDFKNDRVAGIFIAPDVTAIFLAAEDDILIELPESTVLCESPSSTNASMSPGRQDTNRDSQMQSSSTMDVAVIRSTNWWPGNVADSGQGLEESSEKEDDLSATMRTVAPPEPPKLTEEQRMEEFAMSTFNASMRQVKIDFLASGFEPDVIAGATGMVKGSGVAASVGPNQSKTESRVGSKHSKVKDQQATMFSNIGVSSVVKGRILDTLGSQAAVDRMHELEKLRKCWDLLQQMAKNPPELPTSILLVGGHVLLCMVFDTIDKTRDSDTFGVSIGTNVGLEFFIRQLRNTTVKDQLKASESEPTVVVLAEFIPYDWQTVMKYERVHFVQGSATHVQDLERAGFRGARAIIVSRAHLGGTAGSRRSSDSRMLLAAHVIESNLPHDSQIPVITDHGYNGSCEFLPLGPMQTSDVHSLVGKVQAVPEAPSTVKWFNVLFPTESPDWSELGMGYQDHEENYEVLDSCDYTRHPRWLRGDMFVAGFLTSVVSNSLYTDSLTGMVLGIVEQSTLLSIPLPVEWVRHKYADLFLWLIRERNLLPLGLYRNSADSRETGDTDRGHGSGPDIHYTATCPPGSTRLVRSDRIFCLLPNRPF